MERIHLITKPTEGYELIDSGGEEKLERFGGVVLERPDPQALWPKQAASEWSLATGRYEREGKEGKWVWSKDHRQGRGPAESGGWPIEFGGLTMLIRPTSFKHVGLFPEQLSNWEWAQDILRKKSGGQNGLASPSREGDPDLKDEENRGPFGQHFSGAKVLNLFAYTGGATLAAAKAGAEVVHVDGSKAAVEWARENAKLSGLESAPIRWIVEDALTFAEREVKRGNTYDAIIMDPPAFGHGPEGQVWKLDEHFLKLLSLCGELLSQKPLFVLINGYAAGYSPLAFAYNLEPLVKKYGGSIEYGELTIAEKNTDRVLPAGIFARWRAT